MNPVRPSGTPGPVTASDEADYHAGPQWHRCVRCAETWICWEQHAHGHPGCPGKPYAVRA